MLNRVTNLTMSANALRTLQTQQSRLSELQEKATTLNKISRPSDDPAATAKALETRSLLAANAQYGRNIDDGNTWLTAADSALEQATNVMHRVKDLTVLAGNGSLNQSGKDAIAIELEALNKELVSIANTKHLGRNIFAGNSDEQRPSAAPSPRLPRSRTSAQSIGASVPPRLFGSTPTARRSLAAAQAPSSTPSSQIADALRSGTAITSQLGRRGDSDLTASSTDVLK